MGDWARASLARYSRAVKRWLLHPVTIVAFAAVAARLVLAGVPLIITNDGVGYLGWGKELASGIAPAIPPVRTPGYPVVLAAAFRVFGVGSQAVLIGQHGMGVVTSVIVAWSVNRRSGRRWAIGMGGLAALSPSLFVWECYALSESLAVCVFVICVAIAIAPRRLGLRGGLIVGLGLGILLGVLCLVKPAAQIAIPFVAIGWWLGDARRLARGATVIGGCLAVIGPWVAYNASRGVTGVASGGSLSTWMGFAHSQMLTEPAPGSMKAEYEWLRAGPLTDARVHEFLGRAGVWSDAIKQRELGAWAWRSAAERPGEYLRAMARSGRTLLELRPRMQTDGGWALQRLSEDGKSIDQVALNFQVSAGNAPGQEFVMGRWEWATEFLGWVAKRRVSGLPQAVLFVGAVAAGVAMVVQRRWGAAWVILGTGMYFAAHMAMLQPWSRLAVPAWACWMMFFPDGVCGVCAMAKRVRGARE